MELGKNCFGEYQSLGIYISRTLTAMSLILNTKIHVHFLVIQTAPLTTFWDMYLHVIQRKSCFIIFCIKFTIYQKKEQLQKFNFSSLRYLNRETPWKRFSQKKKVAIFFHLEIFIDKMTFNFHLFKDTYTKLMILLLLNILLQYSFYFI